MNPRSSELNVTVLRPGPFALQPQQWRNAVSYQEERVDSPSGGMIHRFVSAPDRRLGAIVGYPTVVKSVSILASKVRLYARDVT